MAGNKQSNGSMPIRYDSRGRLVQGKKKSGTGKFLICFLIPYILINGIIFVLVTSTPQISENPPLTNDYQTADVSFTIDSKIPLKAEPTATMNNQTVELSKTGDTYHAIVSQNGSLIVSVTSLNGMKKTRSIQVSLLDDTDPYILEDSCIIDNGYLEFSVADSQSGVNYDGIYAVTEDGEHLNPTLMDRQNAKVAFSMPGDRLTVYIPDLVGNIAEVTLNAE